MTEVVLRANLVIQTLHPVLSFSPHVRRVRYVVLPLLQTLRRPTLRWGELRCPEAQRCSLKLACEALQGLPLITPPGGEAPSGLSEDCPLFLTSEGGIVWRRGGTSTHHSVIYIPVVL